MKLPSFSFTNSGVKADRKAPDFSPQDCLPSLCLSFLTCKGGSFQHFLDVPGTGQRSLWKGAWQVLAGDDWAQWRSHPRPRCLFQPRALLSRGGTQSPRSEHPQLPWAEAQLGKCSQGPTEQALRGSLCPVEGLQGRGGTGGSSTVMQEGSALSEEGQRRHEVLGLGVWPGGWSAEARVPGGGGRRSGWKGHVLGEQGHVTLSWVSAWGWGRRLGWEGARSHWGLV